MACCGNDYGLFSNDESNSKYGEKYEYDPEFKGPKSRRSSTDVRWLVAFLAFSALWLTFACWVLLHEPHNSSLIQAEFTFGENLKESSEIFEYMKKTLWCYIGPICIATFISLILIYVMRWLATPVVWFSMFSIIFAFATVALACFVVNPSNTMKEGKGDNLFLGIFFTILSIVAAVIVYFFRAKIVVAIALIKEGSQAVASSYSTVFFPIIPLIFQIGIFGMFASVAVNIQFFSSTEIQTALQLLNIFGSFWTYWFIDSFKNMVLAHIFSTWYWTFDKKNLPIFPLTAAVVRTTRYHLGTVALGSVVILIGQTICYFIKSVMHNRLMRVLNLWCHITEKIERFLQFLNRNTFIMVAIHGNPFCKSMRDAFNLVMRNIASVYVTNKVTSIQFAFFNIAIAAGMGGLTFVFLPDTQSNLIMYPILAACIGSSIVASTFFGVYTMAIDTMLLCFFEDCERNDGTSQRPYYMSQTLMRVLKKDSKSLDPPPYEEA